jgi:hypothetical protein
MPRRYADRSGFIVRILTATTHRPVGTGFLVDDSRLVTCAHVVNMALGRDEREQEAPDTTLRLPVDFPILGDSDGAPVRFCRVERWLPPPRSGTTGDDIAGLRIFGEPAPTAAGPARLPQEDEAGNGCEVHVFGHPSTASRRDGSWATARIRGRVGGGMLQVDAAPDSAVRLQPGYSGSPLVAFGPGGDTVVGMLSVASTREDRLDAYAVPLDRLIRAWPQVLATISPSPYRGLRSFTTDDETVFVGREEDTDQLEGMVADETAVLVVGPSGIGKSSLVEAGLMPRWKAAGGLGVTVRPGGGVPLERILSDLRVAFGPAAGLDADTLRSEVATDGMAAVVSRWAERLGQRVLLHLDQFEELLTGTPAGDRAALVDGLFPAVRVPSGPLCLVATLRADFLPLLLELPGVGRRLSDRILALSPMSAAALERAVTEPARTRGVEYESGLAAQIAADAGGGPGSLPLMAFTLDRLWTAQRERRLTFADYRAFGGVVGAINRYAETVHDQLCGEGHEGHVKAVLLALVRSRGGAAAAVAKAVPRSRFIGSGPTVDGLIRHRLLVSESVGDEPLVRLAHESLIRSWPRFARWVDEDADFQRWLAAMEERADTDDLLADTRLGIAEHWLAQRGGDVPDDVVRLVERSRSAWRQRVAELESARAAAEVAADRAREAAAEARARQLAAASELATATGARGGTLALTLAVESVRTRWTLAGDTALRHALRTAPLPLVRLDCDDWSDRSDRPGTPTRRLSATDPGLVMWALPAYDAATETRSVTHQLLRLDPESARGAGIHTIEGPPNPALGLVLHRPLPYTSDGRAFLRADAHQATVTDLATGAVLATDTDGPPLLTALLSGDGSRLAVIRGHTVRGTHSHVTVHDAVVRVTDLATGSLRFERRIATLPESVTFSADCTLLAATEQWYGDDRYKWLSRTAVHDLRGRLSGRRPPVTLTHDGSATQRIVFSPDRSLLVAGANYVDSCGDSHTGNVEVFDLDRGGELLYRHYHYLPVADLVFSPDGEHLAVAVGDARHQQTPGAGQLLEARSGRERHRLHHDYAVRSVTFNAHGSRVAFAGTHTVRVFAVAQGDELYAVDHEQELLDVVFHRDGRRVLTLAGDRLRPGPAWLFESRGAELNRIDHPRSYEAVLVSGDGSTAYVSQQHGPWSVDREQLQYLDQVFDTLTHDELHTGRHHGDRQPLAISPNGDRLLFTVGDMVEVHDVRDGTPPLHIHHEGRTSLGLARFTSDGQRLVTTAYHHNAALLRLTAASHYDAGLLRVIDLRRNATVGSIEVAGPVDAVSDDGQLAAVLVHNEDAHRAYNDPDLTGHGRVAVVRTSDGTAQAEFRARRSGIAFCPGGEWIAALCDTTVGLRATADGTVRWTTDTGTRCSLLTVSPAGTHLAVVGESHVPPYPLLLLDAADGRILARYETTYTASAFSADGRLALCLDDGVHVVDLADLRPVCVVENERDFVFGVGFVASSGSRLIVQDKHSIRVSATDTAALLTEAKARLTRELTDSERRRHLRTGD